MKIITALVLTVALVSPAWSQLFQKEHVAAEAQWVTHVRVNDLFKTKVGERLAQQMEEGDANHELAAFRAMFQLNPQKDLASVTLYGNAETPDAGVAIVQGLFKRDHIVTTLKAMQGYREHKLKNGVVHEWPMEQEAQGETPDATNPIFGSFHGDGVMVLSGALASAESALDVLNRVKPSLSNPEILRGLGQASPGVYFQAAADLTRMDLSQAPGGEMMRQMKSLRLTVGESLNTMNVHLELGAVSAEAAKQMHDMAQGYLALMQMQQAGNPGLAKLMQALSFNLDGSNIRVALKIPVADAIEAINRQPQMGGGRAIRAE